MADEIIEPTVDTPETPEEEESLDSPNPNLSEVLAE
jgi:hypothetical protein